MKNVSRAAGVVVLALLPVAGAGVEMTDEQRAELRERAAGLQAERQRNPSWDGGTTRVNESPAQAQGRRGRADVKSRTARKQSASP